MSGEEFAFTFTANEHMNGVSTSTVQVRVELVEIKKNETYAIAINKCSGSKLTFIHIKD